MNVMEILIVVIVAQTAAFIAVVTWIVVSDWMEETRKWRAILEKRGEADTKLTYRTRIRRRRARNRERYQYRARQWSKCGVEPTWQEAEEHVDRWEVETADPYGLKR